MIVISRALVLAQIEDADQTALYPVIGWNNLVTVSNIEATTEDADHPATNLANPATHLKWVGGVNTAGEEYITVTTNTVEDVDYFAVAKHNFGTAQITVSVEGCEDLSQSPQVWTEIVEEFIPADDSPLLCRYTPGPRGAVRMRLQEGDAVPEAAVVHVGKLLIMERGIKIDVDHTPINLGRRSDVVNGTSESGNALGKIKRNEWRESVANFSHITPAWYRENFDPFVVAAQTIYFFWAWNPSEYPNDVGYCWLTKDPKPAVNPVTRRFAIDLEMRGVT